MAVNEAALVASVRKAALAAYPGTWSLKVVGGPYQDGGVPDLLLCVRGLLVGLEAKNLHPGESLEHARARATPLQLVQIARINAAGGVAGVVTSVAEALELIEAGLARFEIT